MWVVLSQLGFSKLVLANIFVVYWFGVLYRLIVSGEVAGLYNKYIC
jgi:hypothetical protein